jgi:hypothetical protein
MDVFGRLPLGEATSGHLYCLLLGYWLRPVLRSHAEQLTASRLAQFINIWSVGVPVPIIGDCIADSLYSISCRHARRPERNRRSSPARSLLGREAAAWRRGVRSFENPRRAASRRPVTATAGTVISLSPEVWVAETSLIDKTVRRTKVSQYCDWDNRYLVDEAWVDAEST